MYFCNFFFSLNGVQVWSFVFLSETVTEVYRSQSRGVTRGGRGGRVAHPWKIWGKILEGRGKWWKRKKWKGEGKRGKGTDRKGKKGKWRGKRRENCGGKLKIEGGKGKVWKWAAEDLFFSLFETTKICLGCTKMEILGGNFLASPTFDCTPGYAPESKTFQCWIGKPHNRQKLHRFPCYKCHISFSDYQSKINGELEAEDKVQFRSEKDGSWDRPCYRMRTRPRGVAIIIDNFCSMEWPTSRNSSRATPASGRQSGASSDGSSDGTRSSADEDSTGETWFFFVCLHQNNIQNVVLIVLWKLKSLKEPLFVSKSRYKHALRGFATFTLQNDTVSLYQWLLHLNRKVVIKINLYPREDMSSVECKKVVSAFSSICTKSNCVLRFLLYFIVFWHLIFSIKIQILWVETCIMAQNVAFYLCFYHL